MWHPRRGGADDVDEDENEQHARPAAPDVSEHILGARVEEDPGPGQRRVPAEPAVRASDDPGKTAAADQRQDPGPDYVYGYGYMDVRGITGHRAQQMLNDLKIRSVSAAKGRRR